jgi:hypothetical protein
LLWLLGQWIASEAIWNALFPFIGYGTHAITLLAIFLLVAAPLGGGRRHRPRCFCGSSNEFDSTRCRNT